MCALCKHERDSKRSHYKLRSPEGGSGKRFHVCAECVELEVAKMVKDSKKIVPGIALGVKSSEAREEVLEMAVLERAKKKRGRPKKVQKDETQDK